MSLLIFLLNYDLIRTFDVASLQFPNSNYTWRLSKLLQRGTTETVNIFLNGIGLACSYIFVKPWKCLYSSGCFSVSEGIRSIMIGFLKFIDCLIGLPSIKVFAINEQISVKRSQYLIQDLKLQVSFTK